MEVLRCFTTGTFTTSGFYSSRPICSQPQPYATAPSIVESVGGIELFWVATATRGTLPGGGSTTGTTWTLTVPLQTAAPSNINLDFICIVRP